MALQPNVAVGLLVLEVSISHKTTHHSSGGLFSTTEQLVSETSIWRHTTLSTEKYTCPGGIQAHNLRVRQVADLRLKPCGYWDRVFSWIYTSRIRQVFPKRGNSFLEKFKAAILNELLIFWQLNNDRYFDSHCYDIFIGNDIHYTVRQRRVRQIYTYIYLFIY